MSTTERSSVQFSAFLAQAVEHSFSTQVNFSPPRKPDERKVPGSKPGESTFLIALHIFAEWNAVYGRNHSNRRITGATDRDEVQLPMGRD